VRKAATAEAAESSKSYGHTPVPKKDVSSQSSSSAATAAAKDQKLKALNKWKDNVVGDDAATAPKVQRKTDGVEGGGGQGKAKTKAKNAPKVAGPVTASSSKAGGTKVDAAGGEHGHSDVVYGVLDDSKFEWDRVSARLDQLGAEHSWGEGPPSEFEHVFELPPTPTRFTEAGGGLPEGEHAYITAADPETVSPELLMMEEVLVAPSTPMSMMPPAEFEGDDGNNFCWDDDEPLSPGELLRYDEEVQCRVDIVNASYNQGKISLAMREELRDMLIEGHFLEVRDVIHHHCHLNWAIPEPPLGQFLRETPEIEHTCSRYLKHALDNAAPVQTQSHNSHKHTVLMALSSLFQKWVKSQGLAQGMSDWVAEGLGGVLFASGSHKLQVGAADTDIDCVCVAPEHCSREAFFGSFCTMLEESTKAAAVRPLRDAYVPVIAFVYDHVHVDLLFCRLPRPVISLNLDVDDDAILRGLASDPKSVRSLSTVRVSTLLLELVPQRLTYRTCLRAVRTWAKRRGIYSQKVGFLGGIHWAILVGFICQHHPAAPPAVLLRQFFIFMTEWPWPQPILMAQPFDAQLDLEQYSQETDRCLMPIITPGYPAVNSCINISMLTKQILMEEIWRARFIAERVFKLDSPSTSHEDVARSISASWEELFEETDFFHRYKRYLMVVVAADSVGGLAAICGFIESRLRKLCLSLSEISLMTKVHPFPRPLHSCQTSDDAPDGHATAGQQQHPLHDGATKCKICQYSGKMSTPAKRRDSADSSSGGGGHTPTSTPPPPHAGAKGGRKNMGVKASTPGQSAAASTPGKVSFADMLKRTNPATATSLATAAMPAEAVTKTKVEEVTKPSETAAAGAEASVVAPHTPLPKKDTLTAAFYIGLQFTGAPASSDNKSPSLPSSDKEIDQEIMKVVRFFEATELLQYGGRTKEMTVAFRPLSWRDLPAECAGGSDDEILKAREECTRRWADFETTLVQDPMELMNMNHLHHMHHRGSSQMPHFNHSSSSSRRSGKSAGRGKAGHFQHHGGQAHHHHQSYQHQHHHHHGQPHQHHHHHSQHYQQHQHRHHASHTPHPHGLGGGRGRGHGNTGPNFFVPPHQHHQQGRSQNTSFEPLSKGSYVNNNSQQHHDAKKNRGRSKGSNKGGGHKNQHDSKWAPKSKDRS
jgi:poly(A) polymerase